MKLFIGMLGVSIIAVFLTACGIQEMPEPKKVAPQEDIPSDDSQQFCTMEYAPVCGLVDVQCIKAPCNSVPQTFPNRCHAELKKAKNIQEGECTLID